MNMTKYFCTFCTYVYCSKSFIVVYMHVYIGHIYIHTQTHMLRSSTCDSKCTNHVWPELYLIIIIIIGDLRHKQRCQSSNSTIMVSDHNFYYDYHTMHNCKHNITGDLRTANFVTCEYFYTQLEWHMHSAHLHIRIQQTIVMLWSIIVSHMICIFICTWKWHVLNYDCVHTM